MNEKILLKAIGGIDDRFLMFDTQERTDRKHIKHGAVWAVCAAAVAVCIAAATVLQHGGNEVKSNCESSTGTSAVTTYQSEIAYDKQWVEMTDEERYTILEYGGRSYDSRLSAVPQEYLGEKTGSAQAVGYDLFNDEKHTLGCEVYAIEDIDQNCAVAVKYNGQENAYAFVNAYYRPQTLGQFIDDLSLKDNLVFGDIYCDHFESGEYVSMKYTGADGGVIWDMLLNGSAAANVYSDNDWYDVKMDIAVDLPLLGYKNISLGVTEDGYIVTNILDTGKAFYIGKDKAEAFIEYVESECKGEVLPKESGGEDIPE